MYAVLVTYAGTYTKCVRKQLKLTTDSYSATSRARFCWRSSRTTKTPKELPAVSWSSRNGGLPIGVNERSREPQTPTG